jgi:hypothetical protein
MYIYTPVNKAKLVKSALAANTDRLNLQGSRLLGNLICTMVKTQNNLERKKITTNTFRSH